MEEFDRFEEACAKTFAFLEQEFGFGAPELERLGREAYVRFHKGAHTVSISWEPGSAPIVELFHPFAGEGRTPWADRDGVPYARRFPSWPRTTRIGRYDWNCPTAETFHAYLILAAENLAEMEREFLSVSGR